MTFVAGYGCLGQSCSGIIKNKMGKSLVILGALPKLTSREAVGASLEPSFIYASMSRDGLERRLYEAEIALRDERSGQAFKARYLNQVERNFRKRPMT